MDELGLDSVHAVGNSMGGALALELAKRGRARSVVALAPAGGWRKGDGEAKRLARFFARQLRLTRASAPRMASLVRRPAMRRLALRDVMRHGELVAPWDALQLARSSLECTVAAAAIDALRADREDLVLGELDRISCPVLLATPQFDRVLRRAPCPALPARDPRCAVGDARGLRPRPDVGRLEARDADDHRLPRSQRARRERRALRVELSALGVSTTRSIRAAHRLRRAQWSRRPRCALRSPRSPKRGRTAASCGRAPRPDGSRSHHRSRYDRGARGEARAGPPRSLSRDPRAHRDQDRTFASSSVERARRSSSTPISPSASSAALSGASAATASSSSRAT